ncbi:Regulator of ribosome biosynthesis [Talaromyces islandicus]|uniref:Ribosome biogenesis regulatory protein n=1 Tax=Talaromyces islandicus TaxID=28573 RepID=A0A0U1M7C8_TALIS|nr:Regulator of ribosome biosynthesis [Talaromyces islandicus]
MADVAATKREKLPITVVKENPYTFDLGHLMAQDPNPLVISKSENTNDALKAVARDGAQVLINQLLTTCQITSDPKEGVLLSLPAPQTLLPRFKPLPKPKEPTKWELFAKKKGIGKYSSKPGAALAEKERRKNLVYDETSGEWVPKWGYKGANKAGENDWLVEVPDKDWKNEAEGQNVRTAGRRERKERIKRNDRKMRANERRSRKSGG